VEGGAAVLSQTAQDVDGEWDGFARSMMEAAQVEDVRMGASIVRFSRFCSGGPAEGWHGPSWGRWSPRGGRQMLVVVVKLGKM
jgi:hypothetical protein